MDLLTAVDDDELTAEALAADPEAAVPPDAVSLWDLTDRPAALLPAWYMPAPMRAPSLAGWRGLVRWNVALIIASFLTITAAGLCNTYGQLHL